MIPVAPLFIAFECRRRTDVLLLLHGFIEYLCQRGDIADTEIESLTGDRVQGMGGITYQCHSRCLMPSCAYQA